MVDTAVTDSQAKIAEIMSQHDTMGLTLDENTASLSTITAETAKAVQGLIEVRDSMKQADTAFESHRNWSLTQVGNLSAQISSLGSTGSGTTPGSGRRLEESKAFDKFAKITGHEPMGDLIEWFERLTIAINGVIP